MPRHFLFLLASGRRDGNTELLARRAAAARPPADARTWLRLADLPLAPFRDLRHGPESYPEPAGNERVLADATLAATDLVVAAPLYWYGLPASAKLYLDYWSAWMRVPSLDFKRRMAGKTLWAVCALSDDDRTTADPYVGTLRLSAEYLGMRWAGVLFGSGNRPGDVMSDEPALADADRFFAPPSGAASV
ncbi:MAG: NAD(P)H-dependent oxidoreductase [Gemmataceae bacterium]|nr:NAD(P)H-dependent oxidoreductase [Gemmataceae bacterium]